MGVGMGVAHAFLGAAAAGEDAGIEQGAAQGPAVARRPRRDRGGRGTDVGAIEVEGDAGDQLADRRLAKAGIGAGGARLGAVDARFDQPDQRRIETAAGVAFHHRFDMHP